MKIFYAINQRTRNYFNYDCACFRNLAALTKDMMGI